MLKNVHSARAKLETLAADLEKQAAEQVRAAAEERCAAAKARCPVVTGRLRNSIRAEIKGLEAQVVSDCPYAAAVELGTSKRAPRPFMRG